MGAEGRGAEDKAEGWGTQAPYFSLSISRFFWLERPMLSQLYLKGYGKCEMWKYSACPKNVTIANNCWICWQFNCKHLLIVSNVGQLPPRKIAPNPKTNPNPNPNPN